MLPDRTFLVDLTVNGTSQPTVEVTGPDPVTVENRVRRNLNRDPRTTSFRVDLVREVTYVWNSERGTYSTPLVTVPFWFEGQLPRS